MSLASGSALSLAVKWWAHLYSDHKAVSETVNFVHLGGVLLAGGLAVSADRATLRLARAHTLPSESHGWALGEIAGVHRLVLIGLTVIFATGVLQTLSDLGTFLPSWVFWSKMGLVAVLLGNGWIRLRAEQAVGRGVTAAWSAYRRTSIASLILWFTLVLLGTILTGNG
ncbi:MAG TPA: hypothetical protein VNX15_00750 [Gemmatimonadales bacterium]|jgi:hypothetical protein|nr:hypothetical protein [Gemmatimonadales bacterium]